MLFLASPVWACSDFEDCMNTYTYEGKDVYGFEGKRLDGRDAKYVPVPPNNALLKAIAFKLDEISDKLDRNAGITCTEKNNYCGAKDFPLTKINKTPCLERQGQYYIIGTTIPISKESCSEIKKVND